MNLTAALELYRAQAQLPDNTEASLIFEFFATYCISHRFASTSWGASIYSTGKTFGIDAIIVVANGHPVASVRELHDILKRRAELSFHFLQAKATTRLDTGEILKFFHAIAEFFNHKPSSNDSWVVECQDMWKLAYNNLFNLAAPPDLNIYFAFQGNWREQAVQLLPIVESQIKDLEDGNLFTQVNFVPLDSQRLFDLFRQSQSKVRRTIEVPKRIAFPSAEGVAQAFLCLVPATEFLKLVTDSTGSLLSFLFNDNVRDFQGINPVNEEIALTLSGGASTADKFAVLNNGVTIVAKGLSNVSDRLVLDDYQIVNGCQTTHVIYNSRNQNLDGVYVPVKIVETTDVDVTNRIIRSTNRQTEVKVEAFAGLSDFHKGLEAFYESDPGPIRLWYERRSKQYAHDPSVARHSVMSLAMQVKCFIACFLELPERCDGYFGSLLSEFEREAFRPEHSYQPYYTSAIIWHTIEGKFAGNPTRMSGLSRFKPHLALLMKLEIAGRFKKSWLNNEQEATRYCTTVQKGLRDSSVEQVAFHRAYDVLTNAIATTTIPARVQHQKREFTEQLVACVTVSADKLADIVAEPTNFPPRPPRVAQRYGGGVRLKGRVTFWSDRGYGFIQTPDMERVYFHVSEWREANPQPTVNMQVEFSVIMNYQGLKALEIQPVA